MKHKERSSVVHFRRWGNKSFSAFSSMHKLVKVCVLSTVYFTSLGLPSIVAQSNEGVSKEIALDEIEVDAESQEPMMESELTRIIAVVSKSEIERSSAQSLNQLLDAIPGVDVRQRGAHGTQADLSIRAGSFDQVLIMLNGINISDPQTGHNNLNLPISLQNIERIEILEGAGLRYNSEGAFSGAINIVTKDVSTTGLEAKTVYGDFNFWNAEAAFNLKQKKLSHQLSLNYTSSDGYKANTDFETKRIYYRSQYHQHKTSADFQLGYIDNGFGANSFYSASYPNQYEQVSNIISSLTVHTGERIKFSPKIYYKRAFDRFELFRNMEDAASWYSGHNYHQTDVWGTGSELKFSSALGHTNIGIDLRNERIRSTVLGEDLERTIQHPQIDSVYFTKGKSRVNLNAFGNHTFAWKNWIIGTNLLLNYNGISEKISPYLGLDLSYEINSNIALKASVNQSFRMPTFTELYYNGSQNIGNPDLVQEEAITYDLGVDYHGPFMRIHSSIFYRRGEDIIDWVKESADDEKWQTMNYSQVNTAGFESRLSLFPEQLWSVLSFIEKAEASFSFNHSEVVEQEYISYYALDYLKHKLTLSGDFKIAEAWRLSLTAQHQERHNPTDASSLYEPFWLCDAKLIYGRKHISPFIEISNVFDTTYYDYNHLPQAGRWAMIGLKWKI